jgi:hypothetical protein
MMIFPQASLLPHFCHRRPGERSEIKKGSENGTGWVDRFEFVQMIGLAAQMEDLSRIFMKYPGEGSGA